MLVNQFQLRATFLFLELAHFAKLLLSMIEKWKHSDI
jgi:hypothetical protein